MSPTPDVAAEEAANLAARFTPQRAGEPGTHPYLTLGDGGEGDVLVGTRFEEGRLIVDVDLGSMDLESPFLRPDGTLPMVFRVQGETVYQG
ncbi:hypothetical protein OIE78_34485 (plasmid) [Streptomyces cellulosae]|uniref:hypothetical protein n=1 Tax=Streptomyces TaxID=1883 RepID=UPI002F913116|nr:hypothetical protein OG837_35730 [Streptomyces cellulosae]